MPHVINGIGTWYYGRRDVVRYAGVCRLCHRAATLTSYTTRLWGVMVMIPLIPLGRKRITDKCSSCSKHMVMPLRDWERLRQQARDRCAAYAQSPADAAKAQEAIKLAAGNRDLETFLSVAPMVEEHLASDAGTLCLLAEAYELFGKVGDAERALQTALAARQDDDRISEALADTLLRQGRPEEAEPFVEHIWVKMAADRVSLVYRLAQGYQAKGQHDLALEAFDRCEALSPKIVEDAMFVRLRDLSARKLGTNVPVKPAAEVRKVRAAAKGRRAAKVGLPVLAVALLIYGVVSWNEGSGRTVFLASGMDRAYTVKINGVGYKLEPYSTTGATIPEGDVRVEIVGAPPTVPAETVRVETSFFLRPFLSRTFVINPDGTAVIDRVRSFYAASNPPLAQEKWFTGATLHEFSGIDYPFEPFPSSLQLDSNSGQVSKDGLNLFKPKDGAMSLATLMGLSRMVGRDAVIKLAKRHLLLDPDGTPYLSILALQLSPDDLLKFLGTRLAERPLRMQWHRMYQAVLEAGGSDDRAAKEYDAMLAKEPRNKDLMYLAARAGHDVERSLSLCRQAAAGDAPSAYALYWLGGYCLENGQFHEAAGYARQAAGLMPDQEEFGWCLEKSLLADGQTDPALEVLHKLEAAPIPACLGAFGDERYIHGTRGEGNLAAADVDRLRARLAGYDAEAVNEQVRHLEAEEEYRAGHADKFAAAYAASKEPVERFRAHLAGGDLPAAEADLKAEPEAPLEMRALLYIAAMASGQADLAARQLQGATDLLARGTFTDRAMANALAGKPTMPLSDLLRLRQDTAQKSMLLTALGLHDAAARPACFALVRTLNFDKRFPYLLLKEALDAPQTTQPTPLDNSIGMHLVPIPAGKFTMGSPKNEEGRFHDEDQHEVVIAKPFYMASTTVTQAQWRAVMGTTLAQQRDKVGPTWPLAGEGDPYPMYYVSWNDAQEFCQKLSQKEGKKYRLPTEAEWEYACRAGTTGPYGGTGNLDEMAWYDGNSDKQTHPVGQKKPNAWGLYDMHGNVLQWCQDKSFDSSRVLRGGAWDFSALLCRSAGGAGILPDIRSYDFGFRVVLDLSE